MNCPRCESEHLIVVDGGRRQARTNSHRRRRKCMSCNFRFTTFEIIADKNYFATNADLRVGAAINALNSHFNIIEEAERLKEAINAISKVINK